MSKFRLLFEKQGTACYISHLDLMRTFQRLFLRGGMFIKHSKGFHPHPVMSIVLPLPVGQSSCCELLDFEVESDVDLAGLPAMLNAGCPEGVRVLKAYEAQRPVRELAYVAAELKLMYDNGVPAGALEQLQALFARPQVIIQKKTKRKELADVDMIPLIREITFTEAAGEIQAEVVVSAQNPGLNPALIGAAIERELPECSPDFLTVRRLNVLDAEGKEFR